MEEKLLQLIIDITEEPDIAADMDIDLFDSALMDSIAYLELLVEIEAQFGIAIQPSEYERDEMNTPRKIIDQVMARANNA